MDYFFWHNVDKYLKEKFGEKVYNRMWAYVFIAIYVVYLVCIISDVMSCYIFSNITMSLNLKNIVYNCYGIQYSNSYIYLFLGWQ